MTDVSRSIAPRTSQNPHTLYTITMVQFWAKAAWTVDISFTCDLTLEKDNSPFACREKRYETLLVLHKFATIPVLSWKSVEGRGGIFAKEKFFAKNFHLKQIEII